MRPSLKTPIENLTFCFLDLETTGFSRSNDRICEITLAWWDLSDKAPREVISVLVNPGKRPHPGAVLQHGLTWDRLRYCQKFNEVSRNLSQDWLPDDVVMVAHNAANFDRPFLHGEFLRVGMNPPDQRWIDSLRIARRNYPFKSNRLEDLTKEVLHVKNPESHMALHDTLYLARLFKLLLADQLSNGARTLGDLIKIQGGSFD
jgi:DNA polymerase III epsilon subunit-like protein